MVQQLHQMVLQESVPVHVQPVQVLVVPELQQVLQLAEQLAAPELLQLAAPELLQQAAPELLQQAAPELLQQAAPVLLQPVEQLPLLSAQTLE
jgi:hypothetical protein